MSILIDLLQEIQLRRQVGNALISLPDLSLKLLDGVGICCPGLVLIRS